MLITTVVGARPQFIKAAAISRAVANLPDSANVTEKIVHTGQHYDESMSQVFFDELSIPKPWKNLEVGSGPHGKQTGLIMDKLESLLMDTRPDILLTFGDTNSTLASALVAAKLHIPIAHVEAGLRSFNRQMPEEINRIVTDHVSDWLFCPSQTSADILATEGISKGVHVVGDVMYDALLFNQSLANQKSQILDDLKLTPGGYHVATIHRAETTDDADKLKSVLDGLAQVSQTIVLPLHPRTKQRLDSFDLSLPKNIVTVPPLSYLDMLKLVSECNVVLTDSGGLQKEAYWLGKKCVTLRTETEWTELVDIGWNSIVGTDSDAIVEAVTASLPSDAPANVYGDGTAAQKVIEVLSQ